MLFIFSLLFCTKFGISHYYGKDKVSVERLLQGCGAHMQKKRLEILYPKPGASERSLTQPITEVYFEQQQ